MEEAMELEETNQKSISGVACTKVGNACTKSNVRDRELS